MAVAPHASDVTAHARKPRRMETRAAPATWSTVTHYRGSHGKPQNASARLCDLLLSDVRAAVLLPACFVVLRADGTVLAIADHQQLARGYPEAHQVLACFLRPRVAQRHVVLLRTTLVAVAFNGELVIGVLPQNVGQGLRVGLQRSLRIGAQDVFVVIEVRVL